MKLLNKHQIGKSKQKSDSPSAKKGMFSYGSYLQQRKANPYKISYKNLVNYSLQAKKLLGKPSNNFLLLLENRLDTALCRIRFAQSLLQARQLIYHRKIYINGNPALFPGYELKPGDVIQLKQSKEQLLSSSRGTEFSLHLLEGSPFKPEKKLKKNTRKIKKTQKRKISKKRPSFLFRPLHFEINFVTGTAIYLYPPQKLYYSQRVYPDLIRRSFKRTL